MKRIQIQHRTSLHLAKEKIQYRTSFHLAKERIQHRTSLQHSYYFPSPISRGFGLSEYSEKYSGWFKKSTQTQKKIHPYLKNKSINIQCKSRKNTSKQITRYKSHLQIRHSIKLHISYQKLTFKQTE